MKILMCAAAAIGMCIGSMGLALAGDSHGMSGHSPGHEMQKHGSMPGFPGASGYARGHLYNRANDRDRDRMQDRGERERTKHHHHQDFDRDHDRE